MTAVGLIGSGLMATEVARLATATGLDVTISNSRGPASVKDLAARLGPRAWAGAAADAAAGDIVVLALPLGRLPSLDPQILAGRTVVDLTNYYPHRDGRIPELDANTLTAGEYVQRHLSESRTVRVFSNISYIHIPQLARPAGAGDRTALPLAGDDTLSKATVAALVNRLGFDTVDAGPLAESWRFEPDTAAYLLCYVPESTPLERLQSTHGVPSGDPRIRTLLDKAVRTDQSTRAF